MSKNKAALILKQHPWVLGLAKKRAEEVGTREPYERSIHKGFEVEIPNASDIYAWMLDEIGRQSSELGMESQCWQDKKTKKQLTDWIENIETISSNINAAIGVCKMMLMAGIRLPKTLPWNDNGPSNLDLEAISAAVEKQLELENSQETPEENSEPLEGNEVFPSYLDE